MGKKHNAHMMIPQRLWKRAQRLAQREGMSMTALVIEGLEKVIASRKSQDVDD